MSERPLIILVTRIEGEQNEWTDLWGYSADQVIGFIKEGTEKLLNLQQLNQEIFIDCVSQYDIWVINGKKFLNPEFQRVLTFVKWRSLVREVNVKVHRGGGRSIRDPQFLQAFPESLQNLRDFLNRAQDYQIGDKPSQDHPVVYFAQVVRQKQWVQYEDALRKLHLFLLTPHIRLSILKHRINHLFGSINNDLQALEERSEKGFGDFFDYWERAYGDYENVYWEERFGEVRKLVEEFLGTYEKKLSDYKNIENLLPENFEKSSMNGLLGLLNKIKENKASMVYTSIKNGEAQKCFDWLKELDNELDRVVKEQSQ